MKSTLIHYCASSPSDQLIEDWGWDFPPDGLVDFATRSADLLGVRAGEIVVAMGFLTVAEVELAHKNKPDRIPLIEHLIQTYPAIGAHAGKVFAAQEGVAYYENLEESMLHPDYRTSADISIACNSIDAVLIRTDRETPVLVFTDLTNLREYTSRGRVERQSDPLRKAYGDNLLLAICSKRLLLQAQAHTASKSAALSGDSQRDQVNYWNSAMADSDALRILGQVLDTAVEMRVTDVAIEPLSGGCGMIQYRQHGDLMTVRRGAMLPANTMVEITRFLMARSRANPEGGRLNSPADGQIVYGAPAGNVFVRCSFIPVDIGLPDFEGVSCALRLLPQSANTITLASLNLPLAVVADIRRATTLSRGIILMVGPTGSGKSTTIAGVLGLHVDIFGDTKKRLSIEDPIERYISDVRQFSANEGQKEGAFGRAVKAFMRHDPDLIWVGEIRDSDAAMTATRAANTGHLVVTTFHANDTVLGYKELADMLDPSRVINMIESLSLILSQRLIKELCPGCSTWDKPSEEELDMFAYYSEMYGETRTPPQQVKRKGCGCSKCDESGIIGRLPLLESLPCTRAVKNLMREGIGGVFDYEAISKRRTVSLFGSGMALVEAGRVEMTEIFD